MQKKKILPSRMKKKKKKKTLPNRMQKKNFTK